MWDIIRFSMGEKTPRFQMELLEVGALPKNFFFSVSDAAGAGNVLKRAKYIHFSNYDADIGVIRKIGENQGGIVIGVSDFLELDLRAKAKKLARASEMVKIANYYGVEVRMCSLAKNENELRDAYELSAVGKMIGMEDGQLARMRERENPKV